ncbi:ABC transporter substrate-binding protein [Variovorax sp. DT-64]|uniref:ABC transporter substrate-binding protein n=1 Tax=Variovorax sp. DT-64 TaxID=3396160 RepID=UPI003F1B9B8E
MEQQARLIPALAASWRTLDDTTWEFKLRDGVKFHDGSALTAEDVIFSLDRPATIANSPSSFATYTRSVTGKKAIDRLTVQLRTATPSPLLLLTEAMHTVDDERREQLLQQAAELALKKDHAIIPLYNQVATWAARKGIAFVPRVDEFTLASQSGRTEAATRCFSNSIICLPASPPPRRATCIAYCRGRR